MSFPKRHHYVPEMLLCNFTDVEGRLFVFSKERPEQGVAPRNANNSFVIGHFNSQTNADGTRNPAIERALSLVESDAKVVLDKIFVAARRGSVPGLTPEERIQLAIFFVVQHRRTPEARENAVNARDWAVFVDDVLAEARQRWPNQAEQISQLETPENRKRLLQNGLVDSTLRLSPELVSLVLGRGLAILHITISSKAFVIGSHPTVRLGNGPLTNPEVEMWLPVSKHVAIGLGVGNAPEIYVPVSRSDWVRRLNEGTTAQSRAIAGHNEMLVASLARSVVPIAFNRMQREA